MKVDECKHMSTIIQQGLETNFENFLSGKTITQEEANKIKAVINKVQTPNQLDLLKPKTIIEQGDKIYMNSNEISFINSLKELVDIGDITQQQAEKIIMKQIYQFQIKWSLIYFKNLFKIN